MKYRSDKGQVNAIHKVVFKILHLSISNSRLGIPEKSSILD